MAMYIIMSFLMGFSGNKLFNKDKSAGTSIKCACIVTMGTIILRLLIKNI